MEIWPNFNEKIILLTSRLLQTNKFREGKFSRGFIILNKTGRKNCINVPNSFHFSATSFVDTMAGCYAVCSRIQIARLDWFPVS
jgi:hypothetical protein